MKRRRAVTVLASAILLCPLTSSEAQPRIPRVGLLSMGTDPSAAPAPQWVAFFDALRGLGYVEDQTIQVQRAFAGGNEERVVALARRLVDQQVDVIVVTGMREIRASRQATTTIPIVTIVAPDPIDAGLVKSLARPGGNITGLTFSASGVAEKYVELLHQAAPSTERMTLLISRQQPPNIERELRDSARALKIALTPVALIKSGDDVDAFFARARRAGAGVIIPSDALTVLHRHRVVAAALKHRVPTIYPNREFVEVGGLMAYGPSFVDLFRRAPTFVAKILKGAKPAELPMEQPTKFELVLNLRTATALGLTMPPVLLARADEIVQ